MSFVPQDTAPVPPSRRKMRVLALVLIAMVQGGYMLADGVHVLATGAYFGGTIGPWAVLVRAVGVDPLRIGPIFVALGIAWLATAIALLARSPRVRPFLMTVALLSFWYVPVGAFLSAITLFLVAKPEAFPARR